MAIEVTVFVPFEYCPNDEHSPSIKGTAEIYGSVDDYDVVKIKVRASQARHDEYLAPSDARWRPIRDALIQEQYVRDTVAEATYWEHHAS